MVRLIDAEGQQVGIVPSKEALRQARLAGLDLVEISATARPPVCKIMDFGKYQYEQAKREKEQRKTKKKSEIKGVRIGFKTGDHDQDLKRQQTEEFISEGNKVRVEIVLRGREKAHRPLARTMLEDFLRKITVPHKIEEQISPHPSGFSATLAPDAKATANHAEKEAPVVGN